jgi:hypothetical protein
VLAKVQGESVCQEARGHTTNWEPDTVETEFGSPCVIAVPVEDPAIEEVTKGPA